MTRVAVCDLGTNSTRLLVADVHGSSLTEIERRLAITALGERVDADRALAAEAIARVEAVLAEYGAAAAAYGARRRLAFATSAVRDAADGPAFLDRVERMFGFRTRVLSGDQEARLMFRGVAAGRELAKPTLVVDLGGGSTELVVGSDVGVSYTASLEMGCVRLTERFLHGDPPAEQEVDALRAAVRDLLAANVPRSVAPRRAIGVAGTATTLATLHLGLDEEDPALVHGHVLPAAWIEAEARALVLTPLHELAERPGIAEGRAPVIAGGSLAIAEIVAFFGLAELEISERDILHGAALELAG